jgi:RNA polymerase sigma factor (sigma-70 family)
MSDVPADAPSIEALLVHEGLVRGVARAILRGDDRVDDVVQDTWATSLRKGPRDEASRRGWLGQVARRFAVGVLRRDRARREHEGSVPEPPRIPSPADILAREETRRRVVRALVEIDEPYRSALLLRYYEDLPPREIGKRMGVPAETARTHVKRGLERLRARLAADRGRPDPRSLAALLWWSDTPGSAATGAVTKGLVVGALVAGLLAGGFALRGVLSDDRAAEPVDGPEAADVARASTTPKPEPAPATPSLATAPAVAPTAPPRPPPPPPTVIPPEPPTAPPPPEDAAPSARPEPSEPATEPVTTPGPVPAPTVERIVNSARSEDETPPGMVWVRGGEHVVGTPLPEVRRLAAGRHHILPELIWETPAHAVEHTGYFIGRYEVTNAQYAVFLADSRSTFVTGRGAASTLREIATLVVHGGDAARGRADEVSWRQLFAANRRALASTFPDGVEDGRHADAVLPPGVELVVHAASIPDDWDDAGPPRGEESHPVRFVSYADAAAFAAWAGWHVPTEEEWEIAGRGDDARVYPWGFDWIEGVDRLGNRTVEHRVVWGGLARFDPKTRQAPTSPVDSHAQGAAPSGAHHLLGNVAEWTSSWVRPYPGAEIPEDNPVRQRGYEGDFAKVIRGGSVADLEPLALRLPARPLLAGGHEQPARPTNRFPFVGFRVAAYPEPGRSRLESVVESLSGGWLREDENPIARPRFAGALAPRWADPRGPVVDHVYAVGKAHAIVIAPREAVFAPEERPTARRRDELVREATGENPVILGVFHTDVALEDVDVPRGAAPDPKKGGLPPLARGRLGPGSYVIGLHHGRIGLFLRSLAPAAFLPVARIDQKNLRPADAPPLSTFELDESADRLTASLWISVGGRGSKPWDGFLVSFRAETEPRVLRTVGPWRTHSPVPPK